MSFGVASVIVLAVITTIAVVIILKKSGTATADFPASSDDEDADFNDKRRYKNKALLVGINNYPTMPLGGCVNDVQDMRVYLRQRFGSNIAIKTLLNHHATADNIRLGLFWLTDGVKPDDVRLFHYSGHGTQLPSATETDGYDEAICPVDCNFDDDQTFIKDDELCSHYERLPDGMNLTIVLDSCNSGDSLRSVRTSTQRFLPSGATFNNRTSDVKRKIVERSHDSVLLLAGCRDDQSSLDATFTVNGKKRKNGVFTKYVLQALGSQEQSSSARMIERLRGWLRKDGYYQEPQCEGSSRLASCSFLTNGGD